MARDNFTDFQNAGPQYRNAWEIVARLEVPPSLEVFEHELERRRDSHPSLTVTGFARMLADSYRPIRGA